MKTAPGKKPACSPSQRGSGRPTVEDVTHLENPKDDSTNDQALEVLDQAHAGHDDAPR
jgi:hypothetical protein